MVFKDGLFVVRMDGWVVKNIGGLDGLRLIIFFVSGTKFLFFLQTISIISFWIITVNIPVYEQNSFFLAHNLDYFFLGNQHWWVVLIFGNKCNKIWFLVDGW